MAFMDIFSTDTVGKVVDGVIDSGDAMFYTDEEKARAKQLGMKTKIKLLEAFAPFKLAQRYIAFISIANFFVAFWVGVILYFNKSDMLDGYIKLIKSFEIGWIALVIISFYFGGGFVESFKKVKGK